MYKLIILFSTGSKVINCYDDFDLEEKIDDALSKDEFIKILQIIEVEGFLV